MAKRRSRKSNKKKRSGIRSLKRSGFKGTAVDRTQSKLLIKLARQMKASKPELKLINVPTPPGLVTMFGKQNPIDPQSFTVFSPGRSINGLGLRPGAGGVTGNYLGHSIRPKAYHVKAIIKNNNGTFAFRVVAWTYWVNFGNLTGAETDTDTEFVLATYPPRFYPGMLVVGTGGEHFDQVVSQYPAARRDTASSLETTSEEYPTRKDNWRFVSKKTYHFGANQNGTGGIPTRNHMELNFHFKFNPNAKWDFNTNQPLGILDPTIVRGWVPCLYFMLETGSGTDFQIKAASRFYYRDS